MTKHLLPIVLLTLTTAAQAQDILLSSPAGPSPTITAARLQALPAIDTTLEFGNPPAVHRFHGPLLWFVLTESQLVDPAHHGDAVRQTLRIQGADGYTAILGMGELSPEFENKPALLALEMDGKPLPRPRAIVPGDHRPGRSVRDVMSLSVAEIPRGPRP